MSQRLTYADIPQEMMATLVNTETYLKGLAIEFQLLELVRLRISQINRCAYCIDMHTKEAMAAGEEPLRLSLLAVWRDTGLFSEKEQILLAWAEALTRISDSPALQPLYGEMLRYFDKASIAELTLAIAQMNSWNRLMKAFDWPAGHYQVGQFD